MAPGSIFSSSIRPRRSRLVSGLLSGSLVAALLLNQGSLIAAQSSNSSVGVTTLTGTVTITNPNELADNSEPIMLLIDLTAFIKRDHKLSLPYPNTVVSAGLEGNLANGAKFTIQLPIAPQAALNNVSHGQSQGSGIMAFAVDFDFNDGSVNTIKNGANIPDKWVGWPGGLDSLAFGNDSQEITAGEMVVWSPDATELFPTGYGADGKLFTADDPLGPIPQGWTVIKLNSGKPFEQIRTANVDVPIIEGSGALLDYSHLTFTDAFDHLVADLRKRYVYTDIKHINWDTVVQTIRPLIQKAQADSSSEEFNAALEKMAAMFPDGHVYTTIDDAEFIREAGGGLGMVLGQTNDGQVLVTRTFSNRAAVKAGIQIGARITAWNGQPIDTALQAVPLIFDHASSPVTIRLLELEYITRSPANTKVSITYQNPSDSTPKTSTLTSTFELQSLTQADLFGGYDPTAFPITSQSLPNNIGYIKVNTFETDTVMFEHMWDYIVRQMKNKSALIIDVRQNPGGYGQLAYYIATTFVTQPFVLDETYFADKNGVVTKVGESKVTPNTLQWTKPVAILISPACASACEIFSAIIAHDPAHKIVGQYPTAGVEGGVRPWKMPGGVTFTATVVRFQNPDGSIFLEGTGVQPTVKVPVTAASLLSTNDQVLAAAEQALLPSP